MRTAGLIYMRNSVACMNFSLYLNDGKGENGKQILVSQRCLQKMLMSAVLHIRNCITLKQLCNR